MENTTGDSKEDIVVHLDPLIADIVDDFLQHRRENASAILDAMKIPDLEAVGNLGHDIEGTAGAFGFSGMARIGRSLEQAVRESSHEDINRLADELIDYLERLKIVYE